jgi:hypothetical protein
MESDEIRKCRFCGIHTKFDVKDFCDGRFMAECKTCGTRTPIFYGVFGAIEAWQEMMVPRAHDPIITFDKDGNVRMLESDMSYRDRVDRMAAAIVSGIYSNPTIIESGVGFDQVATSAIEQVDAIDKALAEREAQDV